ncbi:hypothetical protein HCN44_010989 [Aphidius gifuensis]|uniref:Uncharacterized protein n=1 Tax=Aphidius gifuensis TaxID=684658 RepID=A0A834Y906_APHGI|nr:hypothetical protein HCN44_010989 [Aphidius gifuensis]
MTLKPDHLNEIQLGSPASLLTPEPTNQAVSCRNVAVATLQEEVNALRAELTNVHGQLAQFRGYVRKNSHVGQNTSS